MVDRTETLRPQARQKSSKQQKLVTIANNNFVYTDTTSNTKTYYNLQLMCPIYLIPCSLSTPVDWTALQQQKHDLNKDNSAAADPK